MDTEGSSFVSILRLYRLPILFGSISCLLIVLSLVILIKSSYTSTPIQFLDRQGNIIEDVSNQAYASASGTKIFVDIEGAVAHPGVLTVSSGSRVEDVIKNAGGLKNTADLEYIAQFINKAMRVVDGMKIYIPSIDETSHNITPLLRRLDETSQNDGVEHIVSINMATKEQLDTLAGVGPVTAQKIIDNRPYQTLEELVSKKAVGQSLFEKIKGQIDL